MRYRVRTQWINITRGGMTFIGPSCAVPGVKGTFPGEAVVGQTFETEIDCDPLLIPTVEATGTVILERLGE